MEKSCTERNECVWDAMNAGLALTPAAHTWISKIREAVRLGLVSATVAAGLACAAPAAPTAANEAAAARGVVPGGGGL